MKKNPKTIPKERIQGGKRKDYSLVFAALLRKEREFIKQYDSRKQSIYQKIVSYLQKKHLIKE